jgi:hypothetical protein
MQHTWGEQEIHITFRLEIFKRTDYRGVLDHRWRIILKLVLEEYECCEVQ